MAVEDDEENFSMVVRLPSDFPMDGLFAVSDRLAAADVCVPGYIPPLVGLYHPDGYFYESYVERIKTVLLPDRNVASRFAQLAQGRAARSDEQLRIAAALLAFAQCLDVEIEPSVAFHELAHKTGNETAWEELGWFRAADGARPHALIEVALHQTDALAGQHSPHEVPKLDLAKPIKRWRRNYIIALKVVELEQRQLRPVDRVLELFDWMRDDFMFGGPAALLASVYFAPNSPPKRRVFKDKNSLDREAAISGVRNAAWDLTHLSEFARLVNEAGREGSIRYLFASFDQHLRAIARLLFEFGTDRSAPDALPNALSRWWSRSDAERIAGAMFGHLERIQSPDWKAKTAPGPGFIDELVKKGEDLVRSVAPGRRG